MFSLSLSHGCLNAYPVCMILCIQRIRELMTSKGLGGNFCVPLESLHTIPTKYIQVMIHQTLDPCYQMRSSSARTGSGKLEGFHCIMGS